MAFCATGETPLKVSIGDVPVDTYVEVQATTLLVDFPCGGPATTNPPPPGDQVSCQPGTGECESKVGTGDFGETPFPVSDCDLSDGVPGECETVPIKLNPLTECVTFTIEEAGTGGTGGIGGSGGVGGTGGVGGIGGVGGSGGTGGT